MKGLFNSARSNTIIWAHGNAGGDWQHHNKRGSARVNFLTGAAKTIAVEVDSKFVVHAWLMTIGWGVLIPLGVLTARFLKSKPNKLWFKLHRAIQTTGLVFAIIGLVLAVQAVGNKGGNGQHFAGTNKSHKVLGLVVMVLGIQQPLFAIFRPHPPKDGETTSGMRAAWEILHKGSGYVAVVLAVAVIFLGMDALKMLSDKSQTVGKAIYGSVVGLLVMTFIGLQATGHAEIISSTATKPMKVIQVGETEAALQQY